MRGNIVLIWLGLAGGMVLKRRISIREVRAVLLLCPQ